MKLGTFNRWLYRGKRPNRLAKLLNDIYATVGAWGIFPNYLERLEVIGRKSGKVISLPVVIAIVDGERYLVSMLGDNVQWVQNVRANGGRAVLQGRLREEIRLEEVAVEKRAPIIKAYVKRAPVGRPHIPVSQDAPVTEFENIADNYPVFRITSATD